MEEKITWTFLVAGPAGYVRMETFHGISLEDAQDSARLQGFAIVEDEE